MTTILYSDVPGMERCSIRADKQPEMAAAKAALAGHDVPQAIREIRAAGQAAFEAATLPADDGQAAEVSITVGRATLTLRRGRIDSEAMAGITTVEVTLPA